MNKIFYTLNARRSVVDAWSFRFLFHRRLSLKRDASHNSQCLPPCIGGSKKGASSYFQIHCNYTTVSTIMLHYMTKLPMRRLAVTLLCALFLLPEPSASQSGTCYRRKYCSAHRRDTTGVTRNECLTTNGFQSWVKSGDDPSKNCCTRRSGPCRRARCQGACSNSGKWYFLLQ